MNSWSGGYVTTIGYTHGYYRELVPAMLSFAALVSGHEAVRQRTPLRYCELGCGQGFSANLIASANPSAEIYAADFNPTQIAGAQRLAADAGLSNVHFYDAAFAEFASEPSLPAQFDIIALHGIYSWISWQIAAISSHSSSRSYGQAVSFISATTHCRDGLQSCPCDG